MIRGWRISFKEGSRFRGFLVVITESKDAIQRVTAGRREVSSIDCRPLEDEDFEKFALLDGQIIESSEMT